MALDILLKKSGVEDKRPLASQLAEGEISLNYNEAGAFLSCRDSTGAIQQVGGVKISSSPPASPAKQTQWLNTDTLTLFVHDGIEWLPVAGAGGGGGGGGGDITAIIGNEGINAREVAGVVTLDLELVGGEDGLEFRSNKLSASIASSSTLGSVKIGTGLDVAADGTVTVLGGPALQPGDIKSGDGISVIAGADTVEIGVNIGTGLQFSASGELEATGSASPVDSVNGKIGVVVLTATDVGAADTAQGLLADSALQPGDAATPAQGLLADSALQPGDISSFDFVPTGSWSALPALS